VRVAVYKVVTMFATRSCSGLVLVVSSVMLILAITSVDNTFFIGRYIINWFAPQSSDRMSWDSYQRIDTIYSWMDNLAARYPHKMKVEVVGKSWEGRDIRVVTVGNRNRRQSGSKPAIFLEGGIHAREWISPATVTFVLRELVTNQQHEHLLDQFDFFILPVVNPDGYEYSHTTDRLWRKNRAFNQEVFGLCRGVDLNRNFGYKWANELNIFDPRPASPIPCLDSYHGPSAFSEPESRAVKDFVMSKRQRIKGYLAFHSFGNKILYPWGHTSKKTRDWRDLRNFASVAADAIKQNVVSQRRSSSSSFLPDPLISSYTVSQQSIRSRVNNKGNNNSLRRIILGPELQEQVSQTKEGYSYGQAPDTIYRVTGGSDDWARGRAGIKWVLLFELPGGVYNFLLPPRYIRSVGSSIMSGVTAMANHISVS